MIKIAYFKGKENIDTRELEQLKDEISNKLPEIGFKEGEVEQKIPEIMSELSEIFEKYRVSEAVEIERKSDDTVELKLKTNKPPFVAVGLLPNLGATSTVLLRLKEHCPCDPGDHPRDCCWKSS